MANIATYLEGRILGKRYTCHHCGKKVRQLAEGTALCDACWRELKYRAIGEGLSNLFKMCKRGKG